MADNPKKVDAVILGYNLIATTDNKYTTFLQYEVTQIQKVDAKSPDASKKIGSIEQSYNNYLATRNSKVGGELQALIPVFNSLSPGDKQLVTNSPSYSKYLAVNKKFVDTTNRHSEILAAKTTEINAANGVVVNKPANTPATPSPNPNVNGAASDDSGAKQPNSAGSNNVPSSDTKTTLPVINLSADKKATTGENYQFVVSEFDTKSSLASDPPGKRLQNPLGDLSNYTYQLTLYMLTPDAVEEFNATGKQKIRLVDPATSTSGAYIIAQSGGIKDPATRAPNFELDYGIDNLSMKTYYNGPATGSPVARTEIQFQITEPYGFSFLSNLRKAGDALLTSGPQNPTRQYFVLGVRFYGYDGSGNVMKPYQTNDNENNPSPNASDGSLFEYFIDITINSLDFKVDGKTIKYQIKAASGGSEAIKVSKGYVQTNKNIEANTVGVAIDKLLVALNDEQEALAKGNPPALKYPTKYSVVWMPGTEDIYNATIVSSARLEKLRWPGSGAKTTEQSNVKGEVTTQTADNNSKQITFGGASVTIVDAMTKIIMQSSYLEDALVAVYTSDLEADTETKALYKDHKAYQRKNVSWFSCTPQIYDIQWDEKVRDWSYSIKYIIQKYETPIVDSPLTVNNKKYPGPYKRYEYWYTGKNSEIISYEQQLNNAFHNIVLAASDSQLNQNSPQPTPTDNSQTPLSTNMQTNQNRQGSLGYGLEAQNSYLTALFDPGSQHTAKITILGDPDFLITDTTYSENQVYQQYYGSNGYSVKPSSIQTFIEIDFKEAVDYTSDTGTLNINDSILFWRYASELEEAKKRFNIKGISYQLITVTSTFNNGRFQQLLDCRINDFFDLNSELTSSLNNRESVVPNNQTGPAPGDAKSSTSQTSGTKQDAPVNPANNTTVNPLVRAAEEAKT